MRVIAGEFRHRKLLEVNSDFTRETRDQVKESIFNSIQQHLIDATVLDLFGGSGSLGIEAISRGSKHVTFVENSSEAILTTKANIASLEIGNKTTVVHSDYSKFLHKTSDSFDLILLDPPYSLHVMEDIVRIIQKRELLTSDGIILALYSKNVSLNLDPFDIICYKEKKIGVTKISFLKWGI